MKPERVAELVVAGSKRFVEPLVERIKRLEQRSQQVAALEARIARLEAAQAESGADDLGGA